jgi:hypothetical protein
VTNHGGLMYVVDLDNGCLIRWRRAVNLILGMETIIAQSSPKYGEYLVQDNRSMTVEMTVEMNQQSSFNRL